LHQAASLAQQTHEIISSQGIIVGLDVLLVYLSSLDRNLSFHSFYFLALDMANRITKTQTGKNAGRLAKAIQKLLTELNNATQDEKLTHKQDLEKLLRHVQEPELGTALPDHPAIAPTDSDDQPSDNRPAALCKTLRAMQDQIRNFYKTEQHLSEKAIVKLGEDPRVAAYIAGDGCSQAKASKTAGLVSLANEYYVWVDQKQSVGVSARATTAGVFIEQAAKFLNKTQAVKALTAGKRLHELGGRFLGFPGVVAFCYTKFMNAGRLGDVFDEFEKEENRVIRDLGQEISYHFNELLRRVDQNLVEPRANLPELEENGPVAFLCTTSGAGTGTALTPHPAYADLMPLHHQENGVYEHQSANCE
jgi:hypothetical protein